MITYTFYQIVCNDSNITETYIGSTKNLKDRKTSHKCHCINLDSKKYNYKIYKFIRDNGGWFNWKFVILDTKECIDKYEAYEIEQSYINELKSTLNTISPYSGLTKKEYEIKYRQDHKEKILQQKNKPYCCNICGGHYTYINRSRHFKSPKHLLNLYTTTSIE